MSEKNTARIIGDVHGYQNRYISVSVLPPDVSKSVQVGDMGVGFGQGDYWHKTLEEHMDKNNGFFIRGNHDNPDVVKNMKNFINDGAVHDNVMYVGGAWSIDQDYRTPGLTWWADEQLSQNQLDTLIDVYSVVKPRVMITHDCPTLAAYYMFVKEGQSLAQKTQYLTRTGEALQRMFEIHQPDFHFFGHWHITKQMDINGTHFHCLGELDYIDFDFENLCYMNENNS